MSNVIKKVFFLLLISFSVEANDFSSARVDDRVDRLERDLSILQKQFYTGESGKFGKAYDIKPSEGKISSDTAADLESRTSNLEEQMRYLSGGVEEVKHSLEKIQQSIENLKKDSEFRFEELEKRQDEKKAAAKNPQNEKSLEEDQTIDSDSVTAKKEKPAAKKADAKHSSDSLKQEYEEAFSLVKQGEHSAAEKKLKAFIASHPDSDYTGAAYYWLGETYLVNKDLDGAALNFLYSYKKFPNGNKAMSSLYKLSGTLAKLGKKKEACNAITKIKTNFSAIPENIQKNIDSDWKKLGCPAK